MREEGLGASAKQPRKSGVDPNFPCVHENGQLGEGGGEFKDVLVHGKRDEWGRHKVEPNIAAIYGTGHLDANNFHAARKNCIVVALVYAPTCRIVSEADEVRAV